MSSFMMMSLASPEQFTHLANLTFLSGRQHPCYLKVFRDRLEVDTNRIYFASSIDAVVKALNNSFNAFVGSPDRTMQKVSRVALKKLSDIVAYYKEHGYVAQAEALESTYDTYAEKAVQVAMCKNNLNEQVRALLEELRYQGEFSDVVEILDQKFNPQTEDKPELSAFQLQLQEAMAKLHKADPSTSPSGTSEGFAVSVELLQRVQLKTVPYEQMSRIQKEIYDARNPKPIEVSEVVDETTEVKTVVRLTAGATLTVIESLLIHTPRVFDSDVEDEEDEWSSEEQFPFEMPVVKEKPMASHQSAGDFQSPMASPIIENVDAIKRRESIRAATHPPEEPNYTSSDEGSSWVSEE